MRRTGLLAVLVASALAACSGGGSTAALSDASVDAVTGSRSSAAATTTSETSSSLSVEDEVRAVYRTYWQIVDAATDPDDPVLLTVATDPVLGFVRDDIATDRATGKSTRQPADPSLNFHRIDRVVVSGESASVRDCFVDGRIEVGADGAVLNDNVVSKRIEAVLLRQSGTWRVSSVTVVSRSNGSSECAR